MLAKVHITLEVDIDTNWSDKATLIEIQKDATESARNVINNALGSARSDLQGRLRIVGYPQVMTILRKEQ